MRTMIETMAGHAAELLAWSLRRDGFETSTDFVCVNTTASVQQACDVAERLAIVVVTVDALDEVTP